MNGVCVIWRGWLDLLRLDGTARLEFDQQRASVRTLTAPCCKSARDWLPAVPLTAHRTVAVWGKVPEGSTLIFGGT